MLSMKAAESRESMRVEATVSSAALSFSWSIEPLPDFLLDPSLTGDSEPQKLKEFCSRWVQLVCCLSAWADQATFGLQFFSREGQTSIYFTATAHDGADASRLQEEVGVLLKTHRLFEEATRARIKMPDFRERTLVRAPAVMRVRQQATRALWKPPQFVSGASSLKAKFPWLTDQDATDPIVIFPWWGPGGPFLLPMESLLSQPVACSITVLLSPTSLRIHEWEWLCAMSQVAQSKGEQNLQVLGGQAPVRMVDPSAALAGRLYMANFRRLATNPSVVSVYCCAADGRHDVARSLAGSLQSLVHEPPLESPTQNDERLPSGAQAHEVAADSLDARELKELRVQPPTGPPSLLRLPDLVDPKGAATLFRLPVSVRGGVPGIRVKQLPPDFHPGVRVASRPKDHVDLGRYHAGGRATCPLKDLTKHTLVTGFTGSGKTVTVLQLLHQVWIDHGVPFLVLESAKQEYRGLTTVDAMCSGDQRISVYTLGNENCSPFRLNPFELLPGVRVEAHISKLQSCFEGAIPPIGPSSSLICESLLRVYEEAGWNLTDIAPQSASIRRRFPVLRDFVRAVEKVLHDRGYQGEVADNLRAALIGRFTPLLLGGKGRMFDTQRSAPTATDLFTRPTVLEMNDLIIEDKALVVMFLLTLLREYRETDKGVHGDLKHLTVVEEAHNVLENVSSEGGGEGATKADTRYKAVQAFCSMITEIRSLGEGLVIADQSPEKLSRDAIRNTNLQLAHQLRDATDRESMAKAMIMTDEQRDFLGKLVPGQAALFRTGLERATFVNVDKYYPDVADFAAAPSAGTAAHVIWKRDFRGHGFDPLITDAALREYMDGVDPNLQGRRRLSLPYLGCSSCRSQCQYRDAIFPTCTAPEARKLGQEWFALTDVTHRARLGITTEEVWKRGTRIAIESAVAAGAERTLDAAWCYFVHLWVDQLAMNGWHDSEQGLTSEERVCFERHFRNSI
jgi:hypothetical protein